VPIILRREREAGGGLGCLYGERGPNRERGELTGVVFKGVP
jgi:hypothetical protein